MNPKQKIVKGRFTSIDVCESIDKNLIHRIAFMNIFGPIPFDREAGEFYSIHHLNGDHSDNRPENLVAITRAEHRRLHNEQDGCYEVWNDENSFATRFDSDSARDSINKRVEEGTHPAYSSSNHMKTDHPSRHKYRCNHCGITGSKVYFTRWNPDCKPFVDFKERISHA